MKSRESQHTGVGDVWIREADDEPAARQKLLRLVAATAQDVDNANCVRVREAFGHRQVIVSLVVAFTARDILHKLGDA